MVHCKILVSWSWHCLAVTFTPLSYGPEFLVHRGPFKTWTNRKQSQLLRFLTCWFFFKKWSTSVLFCGATDTPVFDFWWHLPWVSKGGSVGCMFCHLYAMDSSDSPLVQHLLSSWWHHGSQALLIHVHTGTGTSIVWSVDKKTLTAADFYDCSTCLTGGVRVLSFVKTSSD